MTGQEQPPAPVPFRSAEEDQKRRQMARWFAAICLVLAMLWGARMVRKAYPYEIVLQSMYRGVPEASSLHRVYLRVISNERSKPHAKAIYFHDSPLPSVLTRYSRKTRMRLTQGTYRVEVKLTYKGKPTHKLVQVVQVREGGTFYILLRKAKPVTTR